MKPKAKPPSPSKTRWKYASVVTFILLYYLISVTLSMFNTQVLGKSRMNFPFPIFAALIYDIIQFILATSIMSGLAARDKEAVGPVAAYKQLGAGRFWKVIFPCAVAAGLDIALSNCSLKHVSLSFYTMVKSSSPMFILIFAFVFRLEKLSWALGGIVAVIGVGTLMTVYNPAAFDLLGFVLVGSAAVMSGVRWALTQLIIEHQVARDEQVKAADGPLSAILFLTPPIGLIMAILCATFEGLPTVYSGLFASSASAINAAIICTVGGLLTFSLILTEYKVVENSSVITLSISGIVKEIMLITVSVLFFKDQLLPINYVGLFVSILGIVGYNWHKVTRQKGRRHTKVGDVLYLALPVDDSPELYLNPFEDDSDAEDSSLAPDDEYVELETQTAAAKKPSGRSRSHDALGHKSGDPNSASGILSEAEEYFQGLKSQWASLPALDHHPIIKPEAQPNDNKV